MQQLATSLDGFKGPYILTRDIQPGRINQTYYLRLTAWGGEKPYRWEIVLGMLT